MANEVPPEASADLDTMGCGDLMIALRKVIRPLTAGQTVCIHATDPGAPHDIPAWCRMTGHKLVSSDGSEYVVRKRDDDYG